MLMRIGAAVLSRNIHDLSNCMVTILAIAFVMPMASHASDLEAFIANPPSIENAPWGKEDAPSKQIPLYQLRLLSGKTDQEKGIAVANLAFIARRMSHHTLAQPASHELLEKWVMPNMEYTRGFRLSSACSWRKVMLHCITAYGELSDREKEEACMKQFYEANYQNGDRDLMVYMLAYQQARHGDYQHAMKTLDFLKEGCKWAAHRKKLKRAWTKLNREQQEKLLKHE